MNTVLLKEGLYITSNELQLYNFIHTKNSPQVDLMGTCVL